ncbi:E3 ubiquitin-protein ligase DTX3L-like [Mya arenaria]|uniref:E3 ubiquitin-protein ligase DTX3L-like n=1 Tax=Mya arenaria TaxID=6604 RepID=UPI0022E94D39|nr:E3 ubiquitin-protein ligase DTX3L-like [Mya arenaria]
MGYGEQRIIMLIFTFPDGIQTAHHPSPGSSYKGDTFTGYLHCNSEGKLLCSMLKAAFRRGLVFTLGKEGKVVLDGVSLYIRPVYLNTWKINPDYVKYVQTLKAELAAKGITEADIDQEEKLVETFTVDGLKSR